jgi:P27 family predicted phage terminase small subunit
VSARKPPERRQGRGTADLATEPAYGLVEPPPAPLGLSEDIEAAWHAFWRLAPLSKRVSAADVLPLIRLFQLYETYRATMADFLAERYVEGERGKLVAHPGWSIANAAMRQILPLEKQFGVTPKARAELGINLDVSTNPEKGAEPMDFTDEG